MESFWATLKLKLVFRQSFDTRAQARTLIFDYIETFYNRHRADSALAYHSPVDFKLLNNKLNGRSYCAFLRGKPSYLSRLTRQRIGCRVQQGPFAGLNMFT